MVKVEAIKATFDFYRILLISGILLYCWIIPKINALADRVDAVEDNINKVIKQEFEMIHNEAERGKALFHSSCLLRDLSLACFGLQKFWLYPL